MATTTNTSGQAGSKEAIIQTGRRWWPERLRISGIRARIIITVSASLLAMTVVLGIITYQTMSVRLIAQQKELLRQDSQFASMQFATFLKTIRTDTLMLASQVRLGGLDTALAAEHLSDWRSVMQAKPAYGGLRVLAADGRRLLELRRDGTDISTVSVNTTGSVLDLRDAARGRQLDDGAAWISDIERDPETGRPTLRVLTPLTPGTGRSTAVDPGYQRGHREVARSAHARVHHIRPVCQRHAVFHHQQHWCIHLAPRSQQDHLVQRHQSLAAEG
jgi:hypothetical protein